MQFAAWMLHITWKQTRFDIELSDQQQNDTVELLARRLNEKKKKEEKGNLFIFKNVSVLFLKISCVVQVSPRTEILKSNM